MKHGMQRRRYGRSRARGRLKYETDESGCGQALDLEGTMRGWAGL